MPLATWLWNWLEHRPRAAATADPLVKFARLTVERLEDRRVLSATLVSLANPNVVVNITGNDTVTVSVNSQNNLVITDTDNATPHIVLALSNINSLTFNGDGGTQSVVFGGTNPIDLAALNITNGIENVSFQQDVIADEGGVLIHALQDVTFSAGADILCSAGDVSITADNDFTMDGGSSITADAPGNSLSIALSAGDDLTVTALHAGLGVTLSAGTTTPDTASLQVMGAVSADAGSVSISSVDSIHFTANGDVTVSNGSLSVTAGTGSTDTLTMSDGTVFSVNHTSASFVDLSAGGNIHLAEISGTNLDTVTITSTGGAITDVTAAETANITAHAIALRARNGIGVGSGANVDIDMDADQLAFSCTNAGVNVSNFGDLTLTTVDGLTTALGFGGGTLFASGSLTIAMNTQVGGTFNFIAGDDPRAINDLTLSADITHLTGQGELFFQAGDDILQTAGTVKCFGAPVGALSRINFTADHEANGTDGDRGGITQTGGVIIAEELQIRSFDAVQMNQANDTHILAAIVTGAGQGFAFRDVNDLTVSRIPGAAGVVGLTTNGGDVTLITTGQLTLGGSGEDILAAGATVTINAGNGFHEGAGSTITAANLVLLGNGTFHVNQRNDVDVLAANLNGTLAFTDVDDLTIGTVSATTGITTTDDDVKLTLAAGNLAIADDIALGVGDLTLNVTGAVTQSAGDSIIAAGLLLLGTGTVTLDGSGNNVATIAASYNGTIAFTDTDGLAVGTVTDQPSGMTASGITTSGDDVQLTVLANGLLFDDDINLGAADLTLQVNGAIAQNTGDDLSIRGLQVLGAGTVVLTNSNNHIDVFAANYNGAIALHSLLGLTVGTVIDDAAAGHLTTAGVTTSNDDVKLTVATNRLVIDDDIRLGSGDLTLEVFGTVTQNFGDDITAHGLQLLGNATFTLTNAGNNVDVFAADFDGTINYTDADGLTVGTVIDELTGMTSVGVSKNITAQVDSLTLNTGGLLTIGTGSGQDITLGNGTVVLNSAAGVMESTGSIIASQNLLLLGSGTFTLDEANQAAVLAADIAGSLSYHSGSHLDVNTVNGVQGISTGMPGNGGSVLLQVDGDIRVIESISTQGGSGGVITVRGGVINAALVAGAGNITILSNSQDLVINADQTAAMTLNLSAPRDVIINAAITTTDNGADVLVTADADNNGIGGVRVTTAGLIDSADEINLSGSDLFVTAGSADSIRIDADGANDQLHAAGNITLQNQSTSPATADMVIDGRVHSTGGDIVVDARDQILAQSALIANNGSVTFRDALVLTGALQVTSGGNAVFQSTVNDDGNAGTSSALSVNAAGTTTFTGAVGNLAAVSSVATNGGGITQICGGSVITTGGQSFADAVILCANTTLTSTSGGNVVFASTVNGDGLAGRSLVVKTSGTTDFGGDVGNTQALTSLTTDAAGATHIGGGVIRTTGTQLFGDAVTLLTNTAFIATAATATGANISFQSTLSTGGHDLTIDAGTAGDVTVVGALTGGGTLLVQRGDVIDFAAIAVDTLTIQAATTSITFHGGMTVMASADVNSQGTITQQDVFTAGQNVSFTAVGVIAVQAALSAGNDLAVISTAASIAITGPVTATNGTATIAAGTTLTVTQAVTAALGVKLSAANGTTLGIDSDVCTTGVGGFVTINGPLHTAGDILTNNGVITLIGPVTLTGNVTWDSDRFESGGAAIVVQSPIATGGKNLTLDAGTTGDITLQSSITGGGALLVEQGNQQSFQGAVSVDQLTIQDATMAVTFASAVNVTGSAVVNSQSTITQASTLMAGQNVHFTAGGAIQIQGTLSAGNDIALTSTGSSITVTAPLSALAGNLTVQAGTTFSATQLLTAGNQISVTAQQSLTLAETAELVAGAGGVMLTAPQIITAADITTAGGDVRLNGTVTLTGNVTINTSGSGSLLVAGSIDAQSAFTPSLFLSTGTGNITVTGNIGSNAALNAIEISDAADVTFGGAITANHLLQQSGLGTTTIAGAVNTFNVHGIQLTTHSIQFVARTSSMDSHGQIITLTADAITLPTTFTKALGSTVTLQTLHDTTSIGLADASQDLNFTDAQLDTIQASNLIIGSATQTAGIVVGTDGPVSLDENLTLLTAGTISVFGPLSLDGSHNLLFDAGNDIRIDGSVTTAAGNLQLLADDDVTMGATGLVTSTAGNVFVRADANGDANGTGGGITMADGARIVVGTGTLNLLADESIVLGQLVSSNVTVNAIAVTSQHGGIVDGGDSTGPNIITTALTAVVTLSAEDGVGSQPGLAADAALETQVNLLSITNTTAGNIGIDEADVITLLGIEQNSVGHIVVTSGGTMTIALNGAGVQSQGGDITLATTVPAADLLVQAAVNSRGGDVTLVSGGSLAQTATAPILSGNGNITATVGGALVMQDGALMDAASGTIALQAVGNVTLGQVRTTNATGNAVLIRSTRGGIVDGGDLLGANIVANSSGAIVTLDTVNGIGALPGAGANAALETQINSLVARNATMGDIAIQEADALLIRSITQSAAGNVAVQSVGDLTLVAGQPGVSTTTGNVLLAATASTANVQIASMVQTNSGQMTVTAANTVLMTATGGLATQTGNVTILADADGSLGGSGGAITMADGATINAGSGNITMKADGNITVGRAVTSATVSLMTTSGGIVDGGDLGGANIVAGDLVIRAVTGVGSNNTLETAVHQLAIMNTAGGSIRIDNNTGGLLSIGTIQAVTGITNIGATTGSISVVNNGAVAVNGAIRNATGGDIVLQATNNGGDDDNLTVNAVIAATNGNGKIDLQAGHNLVINDSGADVDLSVVNNGTIVGNAVGDVIISSDVVIQSTTGTITDVNPVLVNVLTPQITALGIGTITMTVQRPFEIGTVIVIDWGDGTIDTFVVTEANQLTLVFEHRYFGPPDPLEPAKDIPLQITVLAPGFTTGATPSNTPGTQQVTTGSYVPNIQFFAHGQTVTPTSFGPLNETVLNTVFKTPGEGLASFAFDLTPPVEYLTFPEPPKVDASLLAVPQPPAQANAVDAMVTRVDDRLVDERIVLLEVFAPDGQLQDRVVLSEDVLDHLDDVVRGLPDGHYRFLLREAGESRTRLLQEFDVRQGRIAGSNDNTGDRPPSLMIKPPTTSTPAETSPADALRPENGMDAAALVPAETVTILIPTPASHDGTAPDFSRTGRLLRRHGLC